jgi:hypothetical protein
VTPFHLSITRSVRWLPEDFDSSSHPLREPRPARDRHFGVRLRTADCIDEVDVGTGGACALETKPPTLILSASWDNRGRDNWIVTWLN